LTEIHDEMELEVALNLGARLIGINNRNLKTFQTDLAVTEKLLPLIPADCFVVSESGINCRTDIDRLLRAGAKGFLVGESLMREKDRGSKLTGLLAG
jgi:indole-3-glycerol phosphate synthase